METGAKPSFQPRTKSCVMACYRADSNPTLSAITFVFW
jgi:hypothetical protein